jgi:uncharacterized protein with HEPN domain
MSKRDDIDFLYDIREAISRIEEYTSVMTYEDFLNDLKTQDAVIRNLEIVGEATKIFPLNLGINMNIYLGKKWRDFEISSSINTLG